MSGEFPNQDSLDFGAEVQRYARIGNLWYTLAVRSENPIEAQLFDKAWKLLKKLGLESEARQLIDVVQAGRVVEFFSEEGAAQYREKMSALIKFYRLLEENQVIEGLSRELAQAGYKKLEKKN